MKNFKYLKTFEGFGEIKGSPKLSSNFKEKAKYLLYLIENDPDTYQNLLNIARNYEFGEEPIHHTKDPYYLFIAEINRLLPNFIIPKDEFINTGFPIPFYGRLKNSAGWTKHKNFVIYMIRKLKRFLNVQDSYLDDAD